MKEAATAFGAWIVPNVCGLFAQQVSLDPALGQAAGSVATLAVLAWYLRHNVSVAIPKMFDQFAAEQAKQRDVFRVEQTEQRDAFDRVTTAQRQSHEHEQAELRKMLYDSMASMRHAVHDVRDAAQTAILHAELTSEKETKDQR